MVDVMEQQDVHGAEFERLLGRLDAAWGYFQPARERAFARFRELGFPTTKHEEWRFTNVAPIAKGEFVPADGGGTVAAITAADVEQLSFGGISSARLVFIDGRYRADLSVARSLPRGVTAMNLAEAVRTQPELVRKHLGRYADTSDAFTALNTAMLEDGAFVHIDRNVVLEAPIHLLLISTPGNSGARPTVSHPRHLVIAESGSNATVVEHYVAPNGGVYWSNAVTEVHTAPNAELHHYLIERESVESFNIATLRVQQERDSRFESHTVLLGGRLVRNNVHVELAGENCYSVINGLYLPTETQHHDNHMRVVHAAPHCDSRQFYKGILKDQAHGVFSGRIVVREGAQKTDAKQTNRNLLLSDEAVIDTKPQLEIYADDVKCTHGATTGQIDEGALFYLMARGLPREDALGLLIYAFAHESLERMTIAPVRAALEKLLMEKLPQTRMMAPVV